MNKVSISCKHAAELCGHVAKNVEPLEKVTKITYRVIDVAAIILDQLHHAISASWISVSSHCKTTSDVFESVRFFGVMHALICPNEKGEYFLFDPKNSWQKCVDRVCLAFHTGLKMVNGMNKFKLINLGIVAKYPIGHLPIFKFTYDSFIILSSFFGCWDASIKLPKNQKEVVNAEDKINKWKFRSTQIALLGGGDETAIKEYQGKWEATLKTKAEKMSLNAAKITKHENRATSYRELIAEADKGNELPRKWWYFGRETKHEIEEKICKEEAEIDTLTRDQFKCSRQMERCTTRIENIKQCNFIALRNDLEAKNIDTKIRKWTVVKENMEMECTKSWLRIANAVFKIAVVALALVLTFINYWTIPATLALLGMGILSDSTGLTKILYEDFHQPKPVLV